MKSLEKLSKERASLTESILEQKKQNENLIEKEANKILQVNSH